MSWPKSWKDRLIPPPPGRIETLADGRKINVLDQGEGPVIVLVHGFPGSAYDWGDLPRELANRGYRAIAYDRIGYGHSDRRPKSASCSIHQNADDLAALCAALELENPILAGWSFGGGVVLDAVSRGKLTPPAMILIASIGPAFIMTKTPSGFALRVLNWLFRLPFVGVRAARAAFRKMFPEKLPDNWIRTAHTLFVQIGTVGTVAQEATDMDVAGLKPAAISVPTFVVHGDLDTNVPVDVAEDLHQTIPGATLSVMTGAAHMLPVTQTLELACQMDEYIRDVTPQPHPGVG